MRRLLLFNPRARGTDAIRLSRIADRKLGGAGGYELQVPASRQDAVALARRAADQGYDQVVAIGGDGTINAVATGLAGSSTALGVIRWARGTQRGTIWPCARATSPAHWT